MSLLVRFHCRQFINSGHCLLRSLCANPLLYVKLLLRCWRLPAPALPIFQVPPCPERLLSVALSPRSSMSRFHWTSSALPPWSYNTPMQSSYCVAALVAKKASVYDSFDPPPRRFCMLSPSRRSWPGLLFLVNKTGILHYRASSGHPTRHQLQLPPPRRNSIGDL